MLLYEEQKNKINLYHFLPKDSDIMTYKLSEINKIKEGERVLFAMSCLKQSDRPILEPYYQKQDSKLLTSTEIDNKANRASQGSYHYLMPQRSNVNSITQNYLSGNYDGNNLIKIKYLECIKYFLLTSNYNYIGTFNEGRHYCMHDIIQISEPLYILHLFQQGKTDIIDEVDTLEQLKLFRLEQVDEIALEEIAKLEKYGIIEGVSEEIKSKAREGQKIIQLMKKS